MTGTRACHTPAWGVGEIETLVEIFLPCGVTKDTYDGDLIVADGTHGGVSMQSSGARATCVWVSSEIPTRCENVTDHKPG